MKAYYWKRPYLWAARFEDVNSIKDLQNVARIEQFNCKCDGEGTMTIVFHAGDKYAVVKQGEWLTRNQDGELAVMTATDFFNQCEEAK